MRKQALFLLFFISIPLFAQEEFSFDIDAPDTVVAGESFEVTLTFNKGDLKDYSRFSQDLPSGVSAENITSPNADFTFSEQRVRIIWLKLPADQTIVVKYAITPDERISGTLELSGTYAFVKDGERSYLDLAEPSVVEILPNPNIDQSLIVDIKDYNTIKKSVNVVENETEEAQTGNEFATIVRQKPIVEPNGIVYINLLVNKPEGTSYLKIEETIPGGYSFESINANGGGVSEAAGLVRFVWLKPPPFSVFLVQYRLVPILEKDQEALDIAGTLSYTERGETTTADTKEVDVNISAMSMAQQKEYLQTGKIPEDLAKKKILITDRPNITPASQEKKIQITPTKKKTTTSYGKSNKSTVIDIEDLEAEDGVYFRVQVAAVKYPYFPRVVFAEYDILRDVKVEKIDIWSKYTLGSLPSYQEAKVLKEKIVNQSPVKSPFIVAYRNGIRVPIKDVY